MQDNNLEPKTIDDGFGIILGVGILYATMLMKNPISIIIGLLWYCMAVYEYNTTYAEISNKQKQGVIKFYFGIAVIFAVICVGAACEDLSALMLVVLWTIKFNWYYYYNTVTSDTLIYKKHQE